MIDFATERATDETAERFDRLVELSPSAKLTYFVLARDGPQTPTALAEETLLPQRTTRDALRRLEDAELVEGVVYPADARKKLYRAREVSRP